MFNFEIDWQFLSDVLTMLMFVEIDDTLPWGENAKANNKSRSNPLGTFLQTIKNEKYAYACISSKNSNSATIHIH